MAGYSGTPLAKKLGIKPTTSVGIVGMLVPSATLTDAAISAVGIEPFDRLLWFITVADDLRTGCEPQADAIDTDGAIWVCWPKKTARKIIPSDMTEDIVREVALPLGLVDNKVCAIDDVWSGLQLVWRVELRPQRRDRRRWSQRQSRPLRRPGRVGPDAP